MVRVRLNLPRNHGVLTTRGEPSDADLVERFVSRRDEAAFALLVQRYSGSVWSVCRRLLRREQDAEDAFQAVFILLARKADSIRNRGAVGSWLYGVAYRTAMKARHSAQRRASHEAAAGEARTVASPCSEAALRELQGILDEEVARLAEKYRAPFVLCCLQGLSKAEAAQVLGCKEGTVTCHVARARQLLQKRLTRRGISLATALTAVALSTRAAAAAPALVNTTIQGALAGPGAAQAAPAAFVLADGVLRSLALTRLKGGLAVVLALLTLVAGAAWAAQQLAGQVVAVQAEADEGPVFRVPPQALVTPKIDEQVLALTFSADGKRLLTVGARPKMPGQLTIWDVATARPLAQQRGIPPTRSMALSPDGRTLACGQYGKAVRLRDPDTGAERDILRGHTIGVNSVAFSADSTLLASAGLDRVVKVWDLATQQARHTLLGHTDWVFSVAFFRHGRAIVTAGKDKIAIIWDLATNTAKHILRGHADGIEAVAVSPDDKVVATASWDQTIKLWDAETGQEVGSLQGSQNAIFAVAFSPDGRLLASGEGDGTVRLWDVATRLPLGGQGQHRGTVWTLAFSPDGKLLAAGSSDKTARLWDVAGLQQAAGPVAPLATLDTRELKPITALAQAPDGAQLALSAPDGAVQLRHAKTGALQFTLTGPDAVVTCLAYAPVGSLLASGSAAGGIRLWDRTSGKEIRTLKATGAVAALAFSLDGKVLASAGADRVVHLWDSATGQELETLPGHTSPLRALAFAPDGRSLASGDQQGTVKVWDRATNQETRAHQGHAGAVTALAYSPRGILASAGEDGRVRLWPPAPGDELTLTGHAAAVRALAFAADDRILVSGSQDTTLIVWDLASGQPRQRLNMHQGSVTGLALHPSDGSLISGADDAQLLRWQAAASEPPAAAPMATADDRRAVALAPNAATPPVPAGMTGVDQQPGPARSRRWLRHGLLLFLLLAAGGVAALWMRKRNRAVQAAGSLVLRCPGCATPLKARAELAGKKVKCPRCGLAVLVRDAQVGHADPSPAAPLKNGKTPIGRLAVLSLCLLVLVAAILWLTSVPSSQQESPREFVQSFKGPARDWPRWDLRGPDANECVRFEPEGVHITLPRGFPGDRPYTGLATAMEVEGDFEMTVRFEFLPDPAGQGAGNHYGRFTLEAVTSRPGGINLSRSFEKDGKQFFGAWYSLPDEVTGKDRSAWKGVPTQAMSGRLRLVRKGNVGSFYVAEESQDNFVLIEEYAWSSEPLREIHLIGWTGGPEGSLNVRISNFRLRADKLPDL